MGLIDMIRRKRADAETQYDEPVVVEETWVRKDGKLVKVEDEDENAKTGQ